MSGEKVANEAFAALPPSSGALAKGTPASFAISSWAFQRLIGIAYLTAFGSIAYQITGLIGQNGILPIERVVTYLHQANESVFSLGSLAWFNTSDGFLQALCWSGVFASCLVVIGITAPLSLAACWILWLSIVNIGQEFLSFQWDVLLLEAGFLSIFLAPWKLLDRPRRNGDHLTLTEPHKVSVWLFRWLLFRLMLESGVCKLSSGDETWRSLTALQYHYHTQPLPTPFAWFADKLPNFLLAGSTFATLAIELVVPFFIFVRRLRVVAAISFMLLQLLIALTGNYAYFNLLTFALCFFLIDDDDWLRFFGFAWKTFFKANSDCQVELKRVHQPQRIASIGIGVFIALYSAVEFSSRWLTLPEPLELVKRNLARFYFFNSYGLFASMTTARNEIVVEGSMDGVDWKQYEFNYKPANIYMPPCIVAPCQPRLDWQLWFAALGDVSESPWFGNFIVRLFTNSPEVLQLLKKNPFPGKPPRFIRARLYRYTFSRWRELFPDGQWWQREYSGEFLPTVSADAVRRH